MSHDGVHGTTVRIVRDGTCFIDDEYFATVPGVSINDAVLEHLRLESAALEQPLIAEIKDEQGEYSVTIVVNPDGSSAPGTRGKGDSSNPSRLEGPVVHPPAAEPRPEPTARIDLRRPYQSLPEPFRTRLRAGGSAIEAGRLKEATTNVDSTIAELTDAFGPYDRSVVAAEIVRGDIALITHDHAHGLRIWAFIADTWQRIAGQGNLGTIPMVGNALWCRSQLTEPTALASRDTLITLLQRVPVPGSESSLQNVYRRLQHLTQR